MSLDRFILSAGLTRVEGDLSEEALVALLRHAQAFFEAGGVLSWSDWCDMSDATKEVFRDAKRSVEIGRIATFVALLQPRKPRLNPTAPENRKDDEDAAVAEVAGSLAAEFSR